MFDYSKLTRMADVRSCAAGKPVEVKRQYTGVSQILRQTSNLHNKTEKDSHKHMSVFEWLLRSTARQLSTNNSLCTTLLTTDTISLQRKFLI